MRVFTDIADHPPDGTESKIPALFKDERPSQPQHTASPTPPPCQPHGGTPGVSLNEFASNSRCFQPVQDAAVSHPPGGALYPVQPLHPHGDTTEGPFFRRGQYYFLPHDPLPLLAGGPVDDRHPFNERPMGIGQHEVPDYMCDIAAAPTAVPDVEAALEAKESVRVVYAQKPTSELLSIYEQQQEELVKLSKELEEFTKKNIELSTSNLQQLQKLHLSNSPVVSNIVMQPPGLSQLSLQVRQQSQRDNVFVRGFGGLPHADGGDAARGGSPGATSAAEDHAPQVHGSHADASDESAPQGICTQEDAAAILLQMSRRMVDDPW